MANMYKVIFKGDLEPIYLDAVEGQELAKDLENGSLKGMVKLKGSLVGVGSIKAIVPDQADPDSKVRSEEFVEMVRQEDADFKRWRSERLALPPKERAKSVAFMNYLSQALRGRPLTTHEVEIVRVKQEEFFERHPDFHTANPTCFFEKKDLILDSETDLPMKHIRNAIKLNALNYAERHLNAA